MEKKVLGSDAEQLRHEARLSADIVFGYPPHSGSGANIFGGQNEVLKKD
jgi:hypothetical protein